MQRPGAVAMFLCVVGAVFLVTACGHRERRDACAATGGKKVKRHCECPPDMTPEDGECKKSTFAATNGTTSGGGGDPNATANLVCTGGASATSEGCMCPTGEAWFDNKCQSMCTLEGVERISLTECACPQGMEPQSGACRAPIAGDAFRPSAMAPGQAAPAPAAASPAPAPQSQAIANNASPPPPPPPPSRSKRSSRWAPPVPRPPPPPDPQALVGAIPPPQININPGSSGGGGAAPSPAPAPAPVAGGGGGGGGGGASPKVTYAECKGGMVRNGSACQCPSGTAWENGQCMTPCHPTQQRQGNQCVCPKDTKWNGSRCELWQECKGGQVRMGAACLCPSKTRWDGQRCR